jgi:hypothetical protein
MISQLAGSVQSLIIFRPTESSPGAGFIGDPAERFVYARHGRELMG